MTILELQLLTLISKRTMLMTMMTIGIVTYMMTISIRTAWKTMNIVTTTMTRTDTNGDKYLAQQPTIPPPLQNFKQTDGQTNSKTVFGQLILVYS